MWTWIRGLNCTYDDPGDGGGGGGDGGAGDGGGAQPIALSDDALVQVPGLEKPVKFGEWKAGFVPKADHERVTSEAANYKQQVGQSISNYLQQLQHGGSAPASTEKKAAMASDLEELLAAMENEPFIDGKMAKKALERILREASSGNEKYDKGMGYLYQAVTEIGKRVKELLEGRSEESRNSKIASWLKENDFDPEDYTEMAQDYFAAYEGPDKEIFDIIKKRITQLEGAKDKREAKKREKAKPVFVPGRGGDARIATKAKGIEDKDPEGVADMAFDLFGTGDRT